MSLMMGYLYTTDGNLYFIDVESVSDEGFRCKRHQEHDAVMNYTGKLVDGGFFRWDQVDSFEVSPESHFTAEFQEFYQEIDDGEIETEN